MFSMFKSKNKQEDIQDNTKDEYVSPPAYNQYPMTIMYDDNPLSKLFDDEIIRIKKEKDATDIRIIDQTKKVNTYFDEQFIKIHLYGDNLTKHIKECVKEDKRWITLDTFIKTTDKLGEYSKLHFKRYCDATICGWYMHEGGINVVDSEKPFFKFHEEDKDGKYKYMVSRTYILNLHQKICEENNYSFKRDEYSIEIMW